MRIGSIIDLIELYAPPSLAADWDNSGLQIGSRKENAQRVMVCLDVTGPVIEEALKYKASLIVSHHPLFFRPVKNILDDPKGEMIRAIVSEGLNVYSCHTPFDASRYGINAYNAFRLGIAAEGYLEPSPDPAYGYGTYGDLKEEISFTELAKKVKAVFGAQAIKVSSFGEGRMVSRAAFMGGAGDDYINKAKMMGADVYITADVKNSGFMKAAELEMPLMVLSHFETEKCFIKIMKDLITKECPSLMVLESAAGDFEKII
ncbi:MAG: Nif3-like dinuclear metal center hexameric protein [Eubacteriaceae bacterium]|nr:Nif3-like dinuclear metal center hexameric protein [Eubacteriaceae bacterium]